MRIPEFVKNRERAALSAAVIVAALIWVWALWPRPPVMTVAFLSVGQGDAAVIRTPSGRTMLIDAGPCESEHGGFDAGMKVVVPYLRHQGVNSIEAFVISHPHEDHIGGATAVLDNFRVRTVLDSGLTPPIGVYREILNEIRDKGIAYRRIRRGQTIRIDDGVVLQVLSPPGSLPEPDGDSEINNASVVLRLTYGKVHILFSGDAEREAEEELLSSGCNMEADVLKVPHHGSAQGTTQEWLSAIHPKVAVISVGWRNPFGHPSRSTVEKLSDNGIDTYRTDQDGAVTVTTDGHRISVETAR